MQHKFDTNPQTQEAIEKAKEILVDKKITEIDSSVFTTKKNLPSKFGAIKEKIIKGEVLSLFSDLWTLVGYIVNLLFNNWKDSEWNIIEWALDIKKLDFSTFSLAQLWWDIFDKSFPSLLDDQGWWQWKYKFDWWEKSLIWRLQKKANDGNIVDQVMYTAALSKAKDTYYAKYAKRKQLWENHNNINPKLTEEEIKQLNSWSNYETLARNVQPWDMVFFMASEGAKQQRYDSALAMSSSLPIYHVGIVGEGWNFYHSTMKKYDKGYAGAHKTHFQTELASRKPCKVLVVRPNGDTSNILVEAQRMVDNKMKYSKMDAITALGNFWNIDGKNKVNCGDFVNNALQSSWITGIKNAGAPSKIIEEGQKLWLGFTNQYLWNFV